MKQLDHPHKLLWAALSLQDHPEGLPVDCIKHLCQIYKDREEGLVLFNTLLLHLSDDKIMSTVLHPGLKPPVPLGDLFQFP